MGKEEIKGSRTTGSLRNLGVRRRGEGHDRVGQAVPHAIRPRGPPEDGTGPSGTPRFLGRDSPSSPVKGGEKGTIIRHATQDEGVCGNRHLAPLEGRRQGVE